VTGGLARRYARALLELAREGGDLAAAGEELGAAAAAFDEPRLRAVVLNPAIERAGRRKVVEGVVTALGVSRSVVNLVRLLADRDRLPLLGRSHRRTTRLSTPKSAERGPHSLRSAARCGREG
jgi:F-type H+-transporting ATPase subunit delta